MKTKCSRVYLPLEESCKHSIFPNEPRWAHIIGASRAQSCMAFGGQVGRGIHQQPAEVIGKMAQTMEAIALAYPGKDQPVGRVPLPYLADLRLALNVVAADRLPLVAVFGNSEQRKQLEQKLEPLAWSDEFLGRALYVPVNHPEEFKAISGLKTKAGYVVIQPDIFGLKGKVIKEIPIQSTAAQVKQSLSMAVGQHQPSTLTYEQHRSQGADAGQRWESKTPNTDGIGRSRFGPRPRP